MTVQAGPEIARARAIVRRSGIVAPSRSLLRLESTLRSSEPSTRQLAALIEASPAIAARVLRMANSLFYAPAQPVVTLGRAIPMLGVGTIRQVVLGSLVLTRNTAGMSTRQSLANARVMGNAVRSAAIARALAREAGIGDPEEAFAAGLLHDIGHVYLIDEGGDAYAGYLLDTHGMADLEREISIVDVTHAEVGFAFGMEWELPNPLPAVLLRHHRSEPGSLGAIVEASDYLVGELAAVADPRVQARTDVALKAIGLDRTKWTDMESAVRTDIGELLHVFEIF